jgi:type II secretory pathway pseudopilin PulG
MKPLAKQQGMTLIGLLIGLLISMLCILASLSLYKTLIRVAAESKLDSLHDGQLAAASLVIQMEVQSAGFGIENAGVNDVMMRAPAAGELQLLWRYRKADGNFECRGLHESALTENGENFRLLRVIRVASGCNDTAALDTFDWSTQVSVLGRWRVYDDGAADLGLDKHIADNGTLFNFSISTVACNPYGAIGSEAENHLQLQVTAPSSARLQGAAGVGLNTYDFCLPNTYPT